MYPLEAYREKKMMSMMVRFIHSAEACVEVVLTYGAVYQIHNMSEVTFE